MRKLKFKYLLLLFFSTLTSAFAFQYSSGTTLYGEQRQVFVDLPTFYLQFRLEFSEAYLKTINIEHIDVYDYKTQSDVAMHLVRLRRHKEALNILRRIHNHKPEDYIITKNIGTAYELTGNIDSALYILKSYNNHHPEFKDLDIWVQMKMVEAKINIQRDPTWIFKNKVFEINLKHAEQMFRKTKEATITDPQFDENNTLLASILYHLKERLPYTSIPDLLVSSGFSEAAEIMAKEFSMNHAVVLYSIAMELEPSDTFNLKEKIANLKSIMDSKKVSYFDEKSIEDYIIKMKAEPQIEYTDNTMFTSPARQLAKAITHQEKMEAIRLKNKERDKPNSIGLTIFGIGAFMLSALIFMVFKLIRSV